jgi:hypothetical protein
MLTYIALIGSFGRDTLLQAPHFPLQFGEFVMQSIDGLLMQSLDVGDWSEGTGGRERFYYYLDARIR